MNGIIIENIEQIVNQHPGLELASKRPSGQCIALRYFKRRRIPRGKFVVPCRASFSHSAARESGVFRFFPPALFFHPWNKKRWTISPSIYWIGYTACTKEIQAGAHSRWEFLSKPHLSCYLCIIICFAEADLINSFFSEAVFLVICVLLLFFFPMPWNSMA